MSVGDLWLGIDELDIADPENPSAIMTRVGGGIELLPVI
jgi:hypothetical protein